MPDRTLLSCVVLLLFNVAAVPAQEREVERILLPVSTPEIGGAFGARFITEHFIRNDGDLPAVISRDDCASHACEITIPARSTRRLDTSLRRHILWIVTDRSASPHLYFSTVVRDVGRAIEPWGTEMPTVREGEFRRGRLQILNVPSDAQFRLNLRMYALPDDTSPGQPLDVVLRLFDMDAELNGTTPPANLLVERAYRFQNTPIRQGDDYVEVFGLEAEFPQITAAARLRVEIAQTVGDDRKLWAFVTATNNATQHITILTPE